MLQQMQNGALDMGWIMAAELGSRVPAIGAITAPFVVRSTRQVAALVRHPVATGLFEALPRETGTIGLAWGITGMRVLFSTKDKKVLVTGVRVANVKGKHKRSGKLAGRRRNWKKAYVTLAEGNQIEFFEGV